MIKAISLEIVESVKGTKGYVPAEIAQCFRNGSLGFWRSCWGLLTVSGNLACPKTGSNEYLIVKSPTSGAMLQSLSIITERLCSAFFRGLKRRKTGPKENNEVLPLFQVHILDNRVLSDIRASYDTRCHYKRSSLTNMFTMLISFPLNYYCSLFMNLPSHPRLPFLTPQGFS